MRNGSFPIIRGRLRKWIQGRTPSRMRCRYDTSDVLQETALQAWLEVRSGKREWEDFAPGLLRTMARGHGAKLAEKHDAKCRSVRREEGWYESSVSDERDPEQHVSEQEETAIIVLAISRLDAMDRDILERFHVREQSFNVIASEIGLQPHTVRRRYHAAIERVRRCVADRDG